MSQSVDDVKTAWRLAHNSFQVLAKEMESNPQAFESEGATASMRTLTAVIESILSKRTLNGSSSMLVETVHHQQGVPGPAFNFEHNHVSETQMMSFRGAPMPITSVFAASTGFVQPFAATTFARPPNVKKEPAYRRQKRSPKDPAAKTDPDLRTGADYSAEEASYLRASWNRVVAGEVERSAMAAEVAKTLKRSKSAIQGQFTWMKSSVPRSTGKPRGRPRKDSSAPQMQMQMQMPMQMQSRAQESYVGREEDQSSEGSVVSVHARGESSDSRKLPTADHTGMERAQNPNPVQHRPVGDQEAEGGSSSHSAGFFSAKAPTEHIPVMIPAWPQFDLNEPPQWMMGGRRRHT